MGYEVLGVKVSPEAVERYLQGQMQLLSDLLKSGEGVTAGAGEALQEVGQAKEKAPAEGCLTA